MGPRHILPWSLKLMIFHVVEVVPLKDFELSTRD